MCESKAAIHTHARFDESGHRSLFQTFGEKHLDSKAAVSEVLSTLLVPVDYTHVYMSQWFSARLRSVFILLDTGYDV